MKNLAVIPARSGSQRVKDKNIRLVAGHPLLYYQIICALSVPEIDKLVVSTDSLQYAGIAESLGADVIMRPDKLSGPNSKAEDTLLHVINYLNDDGECYDNVILLQATSPLNKPDYLRKGLALIEKNSANSVVTYVDFHGFLLDDEDIIKRPMSQSKPPTKLETGCFWITRIKALMKFNNRICDPVEYLKLPQISYYEVDTEDDLKVVEALLLKEVREEDGLYFQKRYNSKKTEEYYRPKEDPDGKVRDFLNEDKSNRFDLCRKEISFINEIVSDEVEKKIIDIGCGSGEISSQFSDYYNKYGLEVSKLAADKAKQYIDNVYIGTLESDTYPEQFFDVVFSYHVIEHIINPILFVENIKKIMKTHGKLVLATPNFDSAMARLFKDNYRMLHDKTHISLFSDRSLCYLLEDTGFQIDKIDYPFFDTHYFNENNINRIFDTSEISPPFYGNFMTVYATKK